MRYSEDVNFQTQNSSFTYSSLRLEKETVNDSRDGRIQIAGFVSQNNVQLGFVTVQSPKDILS